MIIETLHPASISTLELHQLTCSFRNFVACTAAGISDADAFLHLDLLC
jgi:hypothetical protein